MGCCDGWVTYEQYKDQLPAAVRIAAEATPAQIAHGAVGLAKVALGVDILDEATTQARRDKCTPCDRYEEAGSQSRCRECNCFMMAKTKLRTEACPLKKWEAVL